MTYLFLGAFFGLAFITAFEEYVIELCKKQIAEGNMFAEQFKIHVTLTKIVAVVFFTFFWLPILIYSCGKFLWETFK